VTKLKDTQTALLRRTVLAGALSAIGLAAAVEAQAQPPIVDLRVINRETGQAARVWRHAGRVYVAGQPGARYSLRVTNNTSGRVLVVMSVDGINIITGETAGFGQRGYVFAPYESYEVSGWRKSNTEVAAFAFAPLPRSYAARTGRPADVGVIGIAAFTERRVAPRTSAPAVTPQSREESASDVVEDVVVTGGRLAPPALAAQAAPSPESARRSEKLGTEHGAREWSVANTVAFERATPYPQLVSRVEYDSVENLMAIGVIPRSPPPPPRPRPFPSSPDRHGYVPDPPYGR
jgi:hypothetical protein